MYLSLNLLLFATKSIDEFVFALMGKTFHMLLKGLILKVNYDCMSVTGSGVSNWFIVILQGL